MPANSMSEMIAATTIGTRGFLFTSELLLQRKTVQERQPPRDHREAAQYQQHAQSDEQSTACNFDGVHMKLKPVIELEESADPQRGQQERYRQPRGVNCQQEDALHDRILRCRESQHNGQNRSHTWGPSKSEGEADHERSPGGRAPFETVQPSIRQQCFDLKDARQMQTEQNDYHARDARQQRLVLREQLPHLG